jgi:hypothetical protein
MTILGENGPHRPNSDEGIMAATPKLTLKKSPGIPKLSPKHPGGLPKFLLWTGSRPSRNKVSGAPLPQGEVPIARVVVDGPPPREALRAEELLHAVLTRGWPEGISSKFLITPGGFLLAPWPADWKGKVGWGSQPQDIAPIVEAAENELWRALSPRVLDVAAQRTRILSLSVDLFGGDTFAEPHAELVALVDVNQRKVVGWTGKSYPVAGQERGLVQVSNLGSHLMKTAGERVLVLGCHDLNMFSARAYANQAAMSPRRMRTEDMLERTRRFAPTLVIQHPHLTDSPRIWSTAWGSLKKSLPTVKTWASGICFYRGGRRERAALDAVLAGTRSEQEDVLDILVRTHR